MQKVGFGDDIIGAVMKKLPQDIKEELSLAWSVWCGMNNKKTKDYVKGELSKTTKGKLEIVFDFLEIPK